MALVFIGIGSNLGNRIENCQKAVSLLPEAGISVLSQSSFHETEPWGVGNQPKFINMVISARTEREPFDLLNILKEIEQKMGRKETFHWGPRVIDLDILLYDSLVISGPELTIPHPHLHKREFVLRPLSEIAPDAIHPVLGKRVKVLLAELAGGN